MVSHNAPEVHILIEMKQYRGPNLRWIFQYESSTNTGQRDQITAKTELQIKKPKIGLPIIDSNGVRQDGVLFLWRLR